MSFLLSAFRPRAGLFLLALLSWSNLAAAGPSGTTGAAQVTLGCRVTWQSQSAWSKDFPNSDPPYSMSLAANEAIHLESNLVLERVDGSWQIVDERTKVNASGAGEYRITGNSPLQRTVSTVLKDPETQSGYVSLRTVDFEKGIATIRFGRPATASMPECLECGFMAMAAFLDCFSAITTNLNTPAPEEATVVFTPGNQAFTATGSTNWSQSGDCGSDTVAATFTLSYAPGLWEAVILPPEEFPTWLPAASKDPDRPGNTVSVNVQLRHRGETEPATDMLGTFYVTLEDVSRQPGYCVNAPSKDNAGKDPDLRLLEADNLWLNDTQSGQSEEDTSELSVTIESYDFGAYGRLRVEVVVNDGSVIKAHLDGDPGKDYLDLPVDDNRNHIADSWERENGVEEFPATWDEANQPAGQYLPGDGISLYEKYRGVVIQGYHQRLDPWKKHLFIYDPEGWAQMSVNDPEGVSFARALDCEVLFLGRENWTGPGSSGAGKRIVNFNSTEAVHAVDQHGLHLRFPFTDDPTLPADYQALYTAKHGTNDTDTLAGTLGCKYPDLGARKSSPVGALVIEAYANNIAKYTRQVVRYHTLGAPEFSDYWDPATTGAKLTALRTRCADLADAYIRDHQAEFVRRNWLHFTRTITHEIGHGVGVKDLKEPRTVGPTECVMRYFGAGDWPRNVNDRFELAARNPWPSLYCRSEVGTVDGISCWGQIEITDRVAAPGRTSFAPAVARPALGPRPMNVTAPAASAHTLVESHPALKLSCHLLWPEVLAGDPLRVQVTLSSAAYQQALSRAAQNGSIVPPDLLHPTPATNWQEGIVLTLWYHGQGAWKEVLAREAWRPHLRPQSFSPQDFGRKPLAVSREWLVSPTALNLVPGDYSLSVLWDGDDRVEAEALGDDGYLSAPTLHFTVKPVADDVQRAVQGHRLAFHAYTVGATDQAWQFARAALAIPEAQGVLSSEGTLVLAANAAVKLRRYREAASILEASETWEPGEPARIAREYRHVLAPEIALDPTNLPHGEPRLTLTVLPGETYEVQASADLITWVAVDRRRTEAHRYEVMDPEAPPVAPRFYRAVWLP